METIIQEKEASEIRQFFRQHVSRNVRLAEMGVGKPLYDILRPISYLEESPGENNPKLLISRIPGINEEGLKDFLSLCHANRILFVILGSLHEDWKQRNQIEFEGLSITSGEACSILTNLKVRPKVTYTVATIFRDSINRTLDSIRDQDPYSYIPTFIIPDICIKDTVNRARNAGMVRNAALEHIQDGWVGFIDDDDELEPGILDKIIPYFNDYDLVIPRARMPDGTLLWEEPKIAGGNVGIWFYYNKSRFPNTRFYQSDFEDFRFIQTLEFAGARIKFLDEIAYRVKPSY
jgi:hypothetical protein